jgi:hypothetical protein
MAAPSCRIVFSTPDAAPATRGEMLRIATVVMGANVRPIPMPETMVGTRKVDHVELGPAT